MTEKTSLEDLNAQAMRDLDKTKRRLLYELAVDDGMVTTLARAWVAENHRKFEVNSSGIVEHIKKGTPADQFLKDRREKNSAFYGFADSEEGGIKGVDPKLVHSALIDNNLTSIGALTREVGIVRAQELARLYGKSDIFDTKTRGTRPAPKKEGATEKVAQPFVAPATEVDLKYFKPGRDFNLSRIAQIAKADINKARKLADLAGLDPKKVGL